MVSIQAVCLVLIILTTSYANTRRCPMPPIVIESVNHYLEISRAEGNNFTLIGELDHLLIQNAIISMGQFKDAAGETMKCRVTIICLEEKGPDVFQFDCGERLETKYVDIRKTSVQFCDNYRQYAPRPVPFDKTLTTSAPTVI